MTRNHLPTLGLLAVGTLLTFGIAACGGNADKPITDDDFDVLDGDTDTNPAVGDNGEFLTADPGNTTQSRADGDMAAGGEETGAPSDGSNDGAQREIVESEVYSIDGTDIFLLNRYRGLVIVDLSNPAAMRVRSRVAFRGEPHEMYVREGRAYVLLQSYQSWNFNSRDQGSGLLTVDVRDRDRPAVVGFHSTPGAISDSRMVGDVIYLVSTGYFWEGNGEQYRDPTCAEVAAGTWRAPTGGNTTSTSGNRFRLYSVNVADPTNVHEVDSVILGGSGQAVEVSTNHVFVADPDWGSGENTAKVQVFDISDPAGAIVHRGDIPTLGYVGDRWKMHEQGSAFFVVSQVWQWRQTSHPPGVYMETFSLAADTFGAKLDSLLLKAEEQVQATRYDGNRAYVVTYRQTDPLFVIDISDPADIKKMGELVVPGWSTHIEPRGDRLLAVGRDDSAGWGSRVKISLFDVADPTRPGEVATAVIGAPGEYTWSEANSDWKAFKIWDELGLITLPVQMWSERWNNQSSRLYMIDFTRETLATRGYAESRGNIERGIQYQDKVLSLSDQELQLIDISDRDHPAVLSSLRLARYVDGIVPCASTVCAFSGTWYDGALRLMQFDATDPQTITYESDAVDTHQNSGYYGYGETKIRGAGDRLYVMRVENGHYDAAGSWVNEQRTVLTVFHAPAGASPTEEFTVTLPAVPIPSDLQQIIGSGDYWWYGGWYRSDLAVTESGALAHLVRLSGWRYNGGGETKPPSTDGATPTPRDVAEPQYWERSLLVVYDITNPAGVPAPVVIDDYAPPVRLDNSAWWYYGRNAYDQPQLFTQGNVVSMPTCEDAGTDENGNAVAHCYALGLDLANPAAPSRAYRINVPGVLVSQQGDRWQTMSANWSVDAQGHYNLVGAVYFLKREGDRARLLGAARVRTETNYGNGYWNWDLATDGVPEPTRQVRDYPLFDTAQGAWMVHEEQTYPVYVYLAQPGAEGGGRPTGPVGGGTSEPGSSNGSDATPSGDEDAATESDTSTEEAAPSVPYYCVNGEYGASQSLRYYNTDGEAGEVLLSTNETAWWQMQPVSGGGLLLTRVCGDTGYYGYWYYGMPGIAEGDTAVGGVAVDGVAVAPRSAVSPRAAAVLDDCYSQGVKWRYIATDGHNYEGFIDAGTFYGWAWYYYGGMSGSFSAVRQDNALYLARGWDGVVRLPLR